MIRALALAATVVACALAPATASAQPSTDVAKARALAGEAGDLLDQKRYAEALERVELAERTFHAPTHLAMIGEALEGLGRLAEALATFEKLAAEPLHPAAPRAFRHAKQQAAAKTRTLSARVPSLTVRVQGPPAGAVSATLDGKALDLAGGRAARVDPGERTLRVEATGFVPVSRKVAMPERAEIVNAEVTLERAAPTPPLAEAQPLAPAGAPDAKPSFWRSRTPAYAALGLGGAGLVVGAVTGGLSLAKVSDLKARCPNGACVPGDQGDLDAAGSLGTTSTVAFAVGAVLVATGVVLFVVNRPAKREPPTVGLHLTPAGLGSSF